MTDAQILGVMLLGILVACGLIVLIFARRSRWLLENGTRTTGTVVATEYRRGAEGGGAWLSQVEFSDGDGIVRLSWLGGNYTGEVEIVHHPTRWKRAAIVAGEMVKPTRRWVRRAAIGLLGAMGLGVAGAGVVLATELWAPRLGDPDMVSICNGSGSSQHDDYRTGAAPHLVVGVDVDEQELVDIGLVDNLGWDTRRDPWESELVLCLDRVMEDLVETCAYGDRVLALYDSDYVLTLREARSGAVIGTDEWSSAVDRSCPFVASFRSGQLIQSRYSTELFGVTRFLRPHVEG